MDWIPIIFWTFKVLVLGTSMFFAIKWHYGQGKKEMEKKMGRKMEKEEEMHTVLRSGGKVAAVFALSLLGLLLFTFGLTRMLSLPFP